MGIAISRNDFDNIKGLWDFSQGSSASQAAINAADNCVGRVFLSLSSSGSYYNVNESLRLISDLEGNGLPEEKKIAALFRDIFQERVESAAQLIKDAGPGIKRLFATHGYIMDDSATKRCAKPGIIAAFKRIFWSTEGSPRPRQIVAEWEKFGQYSGALIGYWFSGQVENLVSKQPISGSQNIDKDIQSTIDAVPKHGPKEVSYEFQVIQTMSNPIVATAAGGFVGYCIGHIAGKAQATYISFQEMKRDKAAE